MVKEPQNCVLLIPLLTLLIISPRLMSLFYQVQLFLIFPLLTQTLTISATLSHSFLKTKGKNLIVTGKTDFILHNQKLAGIAYFSVAEFAHCKTLVEDD